MEIAKNKENTKLTLTVSGRLDTTTSPKLEAELNAGMPFGSVENDTIEEWEERIQKLKDQIEAIKQEIEELEQTFPFTYRDKIDDREWVSARQEELRVRIEMLQKEKDRLQQIVEIMRGGNHGK